MIVNNALIPLDQFLSARLRESGGEYKNQSPYLGVAGDSRLGGEVSAYLVGRRLTDDEFESFSTAALFLGRQAVAQELIEITRLNYQCYRERISRFAQEYENDCALSWQRATKMVIEANRHILNFLSAMRTFLDHTATRLNRSYGAKSRQLESFKQATASAFDSHFSYRFISKLRNYTQHCGMPLGHIKAYSHLDQVPHGPERHGIDFFFDKASLLKDSDQWGNLVEPDLQKMPEQFAVSPHIDTAMECLDEISLVILVQAEEEIKEKLRFVEGFLDELGEVDGTPCVYTYLSTTASSTQGVPTGNISFQRFQMQYIEETKQLLAQVAERNAQKPEWQRFSEGWDRIFGNQ